MQLPTLDDVLLFTRTGPWQSKSGGSVSVLGAFPREALEYFYASSAISGLRVYSVENIPTGTVGGKEYHKLRTEFIIATKGAFRFILEDTHKVSREYLIDDQKSLLIPPYILHTYEAIVPGSLLVVCNTLFHPDIEGTHDTYSAEAFRASHNCP